MNIRDKRKSGIRLLLLAAACFCLGFTVPVNAASTTGKSGKTGKLQVTGGEYGTDYRYANNTLTVLTDKTLTISGNTNEDAIAVKNGVEANLILKDLTVKVNDCALDIGDTKASVKFSGECILKGGARHPGIRVREGASLTLKGGKTDSIQVFGGSQSAGIGSESEEPFGTVIIESGKLQIKGGARAAGIGSGYKGAGGTIGIKGGYLTAAGGTGGASFGCPQEGYGSSSITIDGDAFVSAGKAVDQIDLKRGILAYEGTIRAEGDVILNYPLTIASSQKMIIPGEAEMVIPRNVECKNNGSIIVYGKVDVRGSLENSGEIIDYSGLLENDSNITGNDVKVYDMRDIYVENGSVLFTADGYEQNKTSFDIADDNREAYHIYGGSKAADSSIEVEKGVHVSLTLEDVQLAPTEADSILRIGENAQVTLLVKGENNFTCGKKTLAGGIVLEKNALLEIRGSGSLTVKSDNGSRMVVYAGEGSALEEESEEESEEEESTPEESEQEENEDDGRQTTRTLALSNGGRIKKTDVEMLEDERDVFFNFDMKDSSRNSKSTEVYFDRAALRQLADQRSGFAFTCRDVEIELNDRAVEELYDKTTGDIVIRITPFVPDDKFTNAKAAIGTRPQFDIQIIEEISGKEKVVSVNFTYGKAKISIPYNIAAQEEARNLYVVYVGANNMVEWLKDSYYDRKSGKMVSPVQHFSVYGVGYLTPLPPQTETPQTQKKT